MNEEYNKQTEGLVEEEPLPFLDIPSKLPCIELEVHCKEVPTVIELDGQAEVEMQAGQAAANLVILSEAALGQWPDLIKPEDTDTESDNGVSFVDINEGAVRLDAIEINDGSITPEDQEAALDHIGTLEHQEAALNGDSLEDEGANLEPANAWTDEGVVSNDKGSNDKVDTKGVLLQ